MQIRNIVRRSLTAWLMAAAVEYMCLPHSLQSLSGTMGLASMSLLRFVVIFILAFMLLWYLERKYLTVRMERGILALVFGVLSVLSLAASFSLGYLAGCLLVMIILVYYCVREYREDAEKRIPIRREKRIWLWLTLMLSGLFFCFVSLWGISRLYAFKSPSYDMGIFTQMFHSMRTTGLPMTTLERDGLMSHFHVHVSPIYYCMLPLYAIFPSPITLQIQQAAVMALAVIPLWKLGGLHGLCGLQKMLLCAVLLVFPAFSGGAAFDLHENCFLTMLILWIFYGIDSQKTMAAAVAAALTLMVKEDAPVYVAVIGLWLLIRSLLRRDRAAGIQGGILMSVSVAYFFLVTGFLARFGDGVMTYRYKNFIYDDSGSLFAVIKAVMLSPMKAMHECLTPEKLVFIGRTMLPLLGLPLLTRRYERYILLIPYILVNLMSDYGYQHDIFFQYTFGSNAFLLYLTLINLADFKGMWKKNTALCLAAGACAGCFAGIVAPRARGYTQLWVENRVDFAEVRQQLAMIPKEAAVTADTFYTVHLAERKYLYDMNYASREHMAESDYIVLDPRDDQYEESAQRVREMGMQLWVKTENLVEIYRK